MPFSKKKYNILKEHKKGSSISPPSGMYSKKPNPSCKDCPHRPTKNLTPTSSRSSSNSLISSSKGLLSKNKVPKQVNTTKKLKKIL